MMYLNFDQLKVVVQLKLVKKEVSNNKAVKLTVNSFMVTCRHLSNDIWYANINGSKVLFRTPEANNSFSLFLILGVKQFGAFQGTTIFGVCPCSRYRVDFIEAICRLQICVVFPE